MTCGDAAPAQARDWATAGDGGIFLSGRFGGRVHPVRLTFGIEARGVLIDSDFGCDSRMQTFAGAVARIELLGWKDSRLTLGPVVGTTNGAWGYAGELTAGIARGLDPGLVIQAGAEVTGAFFFNARAAYAFGRDAQFGAGLRFPPLSRSAFCVTGRPLRRDGARAPLAGAQWIAMAERHRHQDQPSQPGMSLWTERARLEWASVPSFCELARQLEVSGAPAALVARAREAAADELRHAVISAQVAGSLGEAHGLTLDPPVAVDRAAATGREGLVRLAVESFLDGAIGEATAAAIAEREAGITDDATISQIQSAIASDETRHAELAWAIIEWTLAADPLAVGAALTDVAKPSLGSRKEDDASSANARAAETSGLRSLGILDSIQANAIGREQASRARWRLASVRQ